MSRTSNGRNGGGLWRCAAVIVAYILRNLMQQLYATFCWRVVRANLPYKVQRNLGVGIFEDLRHRAGERLWLRRRSVFPKNQCDMPCGVLEVSAFPCSRNSPSFGARFKRGETALQVERHHESITTIWARYHNLWFKFEVLLYKSLVGL